MFFFIAGVQPRTVNVDEQPAMCPSCGLYQARLKRVDHYISVFFFPLIRIKKGESFLQCGSCGQMVENSDRGSRLLAYSQQNQCRYCGKQMEQNFPFCPFCGKEQKQE